jgi:4-amino-4-deoxy-L-arabinose transferase-like glycosyltransferase
MSLNKKSINKLFYIFITTHLILWTLVPSLTNNNLPLDTIEALAWGGNLDWGFNKHPPASAFLAEFFYQIFGSLDWTYYLLSQILVVISFFVIFKLSENFFNNKIFGFLSVVMLEGIYFYNYTTPEFNVYITELPFWTLTVYYAYKSITGDKLKDWFLLGVCGAIGLLSHYLFSYILLSITIFFIYIFFQDKKFNFKSLIALEVFLILMIPHGLWLIENEFITITYGLHRSGSGLENLNFINHLVNPFLYIIKQFGILIPFWVMLFFLVKKFKLKFNLKDRKFLFLIFINFIPITLIALTSLITGAKIKTMWMTPFYLFYGLLFVYLFQTQINLKKLKNFFITFLFFFILSPTIYSFISLSQNNKRTDYQGKRIAEKVQYAWNVNYNKTINVVLGDEWSAGNLSYHLKSRPVWEGNVTQEKLDSYLHYVCIENICVGNR